MKEIRSRLGILATASESPSTEFCLIEQSTLFGQAIERIETISSVCLPFGVIGVEGVYPPRSFSNPGETWKILACLHDTRPDLILLGVDVAPAGLLLILNAGAGGYSSFSRGLPLYAKEIGTRVPERISERAGAIMPKAILESGLFELLAKANGGESHHGEQAHWLARTMDRREIIALRPAPLETFRRMDPEFSFPNIPSLNLSKLSEPQGGACIKDSIMAMMGPAPAEGKLRHHFQQWERENACEREPFSYELPDCLVGGGRMRLRDGGQHIFGQIVVAKTGEIHEAAFACKSGVYSISSNVRERDGEWCFVPPLDDRVELKGDYYLLGNLPPQFGHGLLEGFSRWWALAEDPGKYRGFKFLLFEKELPEYARLALGKLGIGLDRVVHCPRNATVERLIVPTRTYRTHNWALKAQANIWTRVGSVIPEGCEPLVFLSRKQIGVRKLRNETAVEEYAASRGFLVVSPETLPLEEQVRLVRGAKVVMGCVGSAGYLSVFSTNKEQIRLILAPRDFLYPEDCLIASVVGGRLIYVLGSDVGTGRRSAVGDWVINLDEVRAGIDFAMAASRA